MPSCSLQGLLLARRPDKNYPNQRNVMNQIQTYTLTTISRIGGTFPLPRCTDLLLLVDLSASIPLSTCWYSLFLKVADPSPSLTVVRFLHLHHPLLSLYCFSLLFSKNLVGLRFTDSNFISLHSFVGFLSAPWLWLSF